MTPLANHEDFLSRFPRDKVCALALADHYQEECGMTRREALKAVARRRRAAIAARELSRASYLLKRGAPNAERIVWIVREVTIAGGNSHANVLLVEGRKRPRLYPARPMDGDARMEAGYILVGARYLLRIAKGLERIDRAPTRRRTRMLLQLIES